MRAANTTTRRAAIGAITAAATAIPAAAIMTLPANASAFAHLGGELQRRWAAYALHRPIYEAAQNRANEAEYQALINHDRDLSLDNDWDEYWKLTNAARAQTGYPAIEKREEETHRAVSEIAEKVGKLTPATLDDLAVLANVAAYTNPQLWEEEPNHLDWDIQFFRVLADHVLRLAGSPLILNGLPFPQKVNTDGSQRAGKFWKQRGMSEERKREIGAALAEYKGDLWKDPYFKVYHSAAAICNCTEEEYRITWDWVAEQVKAGVAPAAGVAAS